MPLELNINDYVLVQLTNVGRAELRRQHDKLFNPEYYAEAGIPQPAYTPPDEDSDGWSRWQLHELMSRLGRLCALGSQLPFETIIRIPECDQPY